MGDRAWLAREQWLRSDGAKVIPAAAILGLAALINRHNKGGIAFATSLFSAHGSSSTVGRILDRHATLNDAAGMLCALEDLPAVKQMPLREVHDPQPSAPPTEAAQAVIDTQITRRAGYRLVPMPEATRHALLAYAREHVDLALRTYTLTRSPTVKEYHRHWERLSSRI